jgi:hypothetical protein
MLPRFAVPFIFQLRLHFAQSVDSVVRSCPSLNFSSKVMTNADELLGQFAEL